MDYLLGMEIDITGCKTVLFSIDGHLVAEAFQEYPVLSPTPGWAEQEPKAWWKAACSTIQELLEKSAVPAGRIAGVGVAGQHWAAVPISKNGEVLAPTPIWTDTRAKEECAEIERLAGQGSLLRLCGNPVRPGYSLPKILWFQKHRRAVYKNAAWFLQSNAFLTYRLTGVVSQDLSQGWGLHCFDMRSGRWDRDTALAAGLDDSKLPPLVSSQQVVGAVTAQAAKLTGLLEGTPVVAGGSLMACGALGAGVIGAGQALEQEGQAGRTEICLDSYAYHPSLSLGLHVVPGRWLLQGGSLGCGGLTAWLQEQLGENLFTGELAREAAHVPAGSDGVTFVPYTSTSMEAQQAKAAFVGLDIRKTRAHMLRAAMEGISFSIRQSLETAQEAGALITMLRTVGASTFSEVWTQMKADVTGYSVEVPQTSCTAALGAALLAGIGTGIFDNAEDAVSRAVSIQKQYAPVPNGPEAYEQAYQTYRSVHNRLVPVL